MMIVVGSERTKQNLWVFEIYHEFYEGNNHREDTTKNLSMKLPIYFEHVWVGTMTNSGTYICRDVKEREKKRFTINIKN